MTVTQPLRDAQDFLGRYLTVLDQEHDSVEYRTVAEAHTAVDMLARIIDQPDSALYRIEKSAPLVDAVLQIEAEAYRRLAGDTETGSLIDEAHDQVDQVDRFHRHVRGVMLALASSDVDVPASTIADLDAFATNLPRWVRSIEALRTKDGAP